MPRISLPDLPEDALLNVVTFITPAEAAALGSTCTLLHKLLQQNENFYRTLSRTGFSWHLQPPREIPPHLSQQTWKSYFLYLQQFDETGGAHEQDECDSDEEDTESCESLIQRHANEHHEVCCTRLRASPSIHRFPSGGILGSEEDKESYRAALNALRDGFSRTLFTELFTLAETLQICSPWKLKEYVSATIQIGYGSYPVAGHPVIHGWLLPESFGVDEEGSETRDSDRMDVERCDESKEGLAGDDDSAMELEDAGDSPRRHAGLDRFMLAWDGMVYPVLQIGPPQDPIADMERLLEEDMKEIAKFEADRSVALLRAGLSPRREDLEYRRSSFSGISRSWDLEHFSALHPVMLALAGEFRLAQRAWEQFWRYSSGARTFSRVDFIAQSVLFHRCSRAIHYRARGDDEMALYDLRSLMTTFDLSLQALEGLPVIIQPVVHFVRPSVLAMLKDQLLRRKFTETRDPLAPYPSSVYPPLPRDGRPTFYQLHVDPRARIDLGLRNLINIRGKDVGNTQDGLMEDAIVWMLLSCPPTVLAPRLLDFYEAKLRASAALPPPDSDLLPDVEASIGAAPVEEGTVPPTMLSRTITWRPGQEQSLISETGMIRNWLEHVFGRHWAELTTERGADFVIAARDYLSQCEAAGSPEKFLLKSLISILERESGSLFCFKPSNFEDRHRDLVAIFRSLVEVHLARFGFRLEAAKWKPVLEDLLAEPGAGMGDDPEAASASPSSPLVARFPHSSITARLPPEAPLPLEVCANSPRWVDTGAPSSGAAVSKDEATAGMVLALSSLLEYLTDGLIDRGWGIPSSFGGMTDAVSFVAQWSEHRIPLQHPFGEKKTGSKRPAQSLRSDLDTCSKRPKLSDEVDRVEPVSPPLARIDLDMMKDQWNLYIPLVRDLVEWSPAHALEYVAIVPFQKGFEDKFELEIRCAEARSKYLRAVFGSDPELLESKIREAVAQYRALWDSMDALPVEAAEDSEEYRFRQSDLRRLREDNCPLVEAALEQFCLELSKPLSRDMRHPVEHFPVSIFSPYWTHFWKSPVVRRFSDLFRKSLFPGGSLSRADHPTASARIFVRLATETPLLTVPPFCNLVVELLSPASPIGKILIARAQRARSRPEQYVDVRFILSSPDDAAESREEIPIFLNNPMEAGSTERTESAGDDLMHSAIPLQDDYDSEEQEHSSSSSSSSESLADVLLSRLNDVFPGMGMMFMPERRPADGTGGDGEPEDGEDGGGGMGEEDGEGQRDFRRHLWRDPRLLLQAVQRDPSHVGEGDIRICDWLAFQLSRSVCGLSAFSVLWKEEKRSRALRRMRETLHNYRSALWSADDDVWFASSGEFPIPRGDRGRHKFVFQFHHQFQIDEQQEQDTRTHPICREANEYIDQPQWTRESLVATAEEYRDGLAIFSQETAPDRGHSGRPLALPAYPMFARVLGYDEFATFIPELPTHLSPGILAADSVAAERTIDNHNEGLVWQAEAFTRGGSEADAEDDEKTEEGSEELLFGVVTRHAVLRVPGSRIEFPGGYRWCRAKNWTDSNGVPQTKQMEFTFASHETPDEAERHGVWFTINNLPQVTADKAIPVRMWIRNLSAFPAMLPFDCLRVEDRGVVLGERRLEVSAPTDFRMELHYEGRTSHPLVTSIRKVPLRPGIRLTKMSPEVSDARIRVPGIGRTVKAGCLDLNQIFDIQAFGRYTLTVEMFGAKGVFPLFDVVPDRVFKLQEELRLCSQADLCTYTVSGRTYVLQDWYICLTCFAGDKTLGCCLACAKSCHHGHDVRLAPHCPSRFFCDCGAGDLPVVCCRIPKLSEREYNSGKRALYYRREV